MDEEEKRREEEKARHAKIKRTLKTIGFILLGAGIVLDIVFFVDMFTSEGMPQLFFLGIIGLPMTAFGAMFLIWGYQREISRYAKNEGVPIVNDAAQELKPAVKAVAEAVKEADGEAKVDKGKTTVCPACGKVNQPQNKFCDGCGARLYKICPACGAKQDADDVFCGECGAKLD